MGCRKQEDGILDNHNQAGLNLIQDVKFLALSGRKPDPGCEMSCLVWKETEPTVCVLLCRCVPAVSRQPTGEPARVPWHGDRAAEPAAWPFWGQPWDRQCSGHRPPGCLQTHGGTELQLIILRVIEEFCPCGFGFLSGQLVSVSLCVFVVCICACHTSNNFLKSKALSGS